MASIAGILNHHLTAGQAQTDKSAAPMASGAAAASDASSSSDSSSATISANDFLTLLVTEMQNQDPTATTDPNEYINQLVQVNSLEQLIDINQNLTTALGSSTASSSGSSATSQASGATANATGKTASAASTQATVASKIGVASSAAQTAASGTSAPLASGVKRSAGNLSIPAANPAANRVAHSLDGRSHMQSITGVQSAAQ
jgi:flagellar basal-body rod modification protein FlgD